MKILQLCSFTPLTKESELWDTKLGKDIMTLPDDYGKGFDIIISAPPCRQFTIANTRNWQKDPKEYIEIAQKCFDISRASGKPWIIENVIGRIGDLIPELNNYRIGIWKDHRTTKKHLIFSNMMILINTVNQENNPKIDRLMRKRERREAWSPEFIEFITKTINI